MNCDANERNCPKYLSPKNPAKIEKDLKNISYRAYTLDQTDAGTDTWTYAGNDNAVCGSRAKGWGRCGVGIKTETDHLGLLP